MSWYQFRWNQEVHAPDSPVHTSENQSFIKTSRSKTEQFDFSVRTKFYLVFLGLLCASLYVIYHHFCIDI